MKFDTLSYFFEVRVFSIDDVHCPTQAKYIPNFLSHSGLIHTAIVSNNY